MRQAKMHRLVRPDFRLRLISLIVLTHGLLITLNSLAAHIIVRRRFWESHIQINAGIVAGLTLIYLSSLLQRRKQTAWLVTILVYGFLLGTNAALLIFEQPQSLFEWLDTIRTLVVPLTVLSVLLVSRHRFTTRSDIQNFTLVLRQVATVLAVALLYGVVGFELLERRDFHQELNLWQSIGYTFDQFGVFTKEPLHAFTYRGKVFLDSLSLISGLSFSYAFLAFFQPLRARLSDQSGNRQRAQKILEHYGGSSEDYFKLWPHDKSYVFSSDEQAVIAYHVTRGVALSIGSPAGNGQSQAEAFSSFLELCQTNDWLPAFVHTEKQHTAFYTQRGFAVQKIGEEAVVNLQHFLANQAKDKYFRQIHNRFSKQGYSTELLHPPHNSAVLQRLRVISDEWLSRPGREERGLLMGYCNDEYLNQSDVLVLRDAAGTIQAFLNQVHSFDKDEANYDLLRFSELAPGNSNDFLLVEFMKQLHAAGFVRLNLGLCPLAGVGDEAEDDPGVVDTVVRFVYTNGDRIYSFSGLHRFKSKYDPLWRDRFIAYRGGLRGLTRTVRALTKAMGR